jgi:hypothetical protein
MMMQLIDDDLETLARKCALCGDLFKMTKLIGHLNAENVRMVRNRAIEIARQEYAKLKAEADAMEAFRIELNTSPRCSHHD